MNENNIKLLKISHRKTIKVSINKAQQKKSNVTLIIGPGYYKSMNDRLLNYLSDYLVTENVNVIKFDYPFTDKKIKMFLGINNLKNIYKKVFEYIQSKEEFSNDYFFVGGKSLSSIVSSKIISDKIKGYLFLGFPQKITFLKIPLPKRSLFALKKPMFFIQGTNDKYTDNKKIELLVGALNPYARLMLIPETDHSLKLLSNTKRLQKDVDKEIADIVLWFLSDVVNENINNN
ncbi:MAG: alpha/beta family hydrolase [Candidatus Marinimicrobia bacterium]|nr:alpha/beta family hydrolase [Candidatus Neomarinimicrobiota bacterium]